MEKEINNLFVILYDIHPSKFETLCEAANDLKKDYNIVFLDALDFEYGEYNYTKIKRKIYWNQNKRKENIRKVIKLLDFKLISISENKKYSTDRNLIEVSNPTGILSSLFSIYKTTSFIAGNNNWRDTTQRCLILYKSINVILKSLIKLNDAILIFNGRTAIESLVATEYSRNIIYKTEIGSHFGKFILYQHKLHDFKMHQEWLLNQSNKFSDDELKKSAYEFCSNRKNSIIDSWFPFSTKFTGKKYLNSKHKNVVFFTSSEDEYLAVGPQSFNTKFASQNYAINLVALICQILNYKLTIRIHPHLKSKSKIDNNYWKYRFKDITIVKPNSKVSSYDLLDQADIVVTFGSTIAMEASYHNKPVIDFFAYIYSGLNIVYEPTSEADAYHFLKSEYLKFKPIKPNIIRLIGAINLVGSKFKLFTVKGPNNYSFNNISLELIRF